MLYKKDANAWWNTFEVNIRGVFNIVRYPILVIPIQTHSLLAKVIVKLLHLVPRYLPWKRQRAILLPSPPWADNYVSQVGVMAVSQSMQ